MRRDDGLDVLGCQFDQNFVELVQSYFVVLAKSGFELGNVSNNVTAFLAALSLTVHPQSDDLGVVTDQLVNVSVLISIGQSLEVIQVGTSP